MWCLIFLLVILVLIVLIIYPYLVKFEIKINALRIKGSFNIKVLFFRFNFKFRLKNGYIYLYYKRKEIKEKLSQQNVNLIEIINLTKQLYFRGQLIDLHFISNFGYSLDSMVSAVVCGYLDVIVKSIFAKIKNNKKSSHILVFVEPKYNEDIFNLKLQNNTRISVFDVVYAILCTKYYIWRNYVKNGKK